MEIISIFFNKYISVELLILIILSGLFITKYTKGILVIIQNRYKILLVSIVFSILFYFLNNCKQECILKYIITYLFATSFYELIAEWVLKIVKAKTKKEVE